MPRSTKILAVVFAVCLGVAISIYAYAQSATGAGDAVSAPQETTQVKAQDTLSDPTQVGADNEGADSQEALESEAEESEAEESEAAKAANDPVEAPGTPGYEEGNFEGQHEFN